MGKKSARLMHCILAVALQRPCRQICFSICSKQFAMNFHFRPIVKLHWSQPTLTSTAFYLERLPGSAINRVSLGVQSFQEEVRKFIIEKQISRKFNKK